MSKPIGATPVLKGKDAERFLKMVRDNENKKVGPTPTPNIEKAKELIRSLSKKSIEKSSSYTLCCPLCGNVFADNLTEEEFKSEKYLQGDEPFYCECYDGWLFPRTITKE